MEYLIKFFTSLLDSTGDIYKSKYISQNVETDWNETDVLFDVKDSIYKTDCKEKKVSNIQMFENRKVFWIIAKSRTLDIYSIAINIIVCVCLCIKNWIASQLFFYFFFKKRKKQLLTTTHRFAIVIRGSWKRKHRGRWQQRLENYCKPITVKENDRQCQCSETASWL